MENLKNVILHSLIYNCKQILSPLDKGGLVFYFSTAYEKKEFMQRVQNFERMNFKYEENETDSRIVRVY